MYLVNVFRNSDNLANHRRGSHSEPNGVADQLATTGRFPDSSENSHTKENSLSEDLPKSKYLKSNNKSSDSHSAVVPPVPPLWTKRSRPDSDGADSDDANDQKPIRRKSFDSPVKTTSGSDGSGEVMEKARNNFIQDNYEKRPDFGELKQNFKGNVAKDDTILVQKSKAKVDTLTSKLTNFLKIGPTQDSCSSSDNSEDNVGEDGSSESAPGVPLTPQTQHAVGSPDRGQESDAKQTTTAFNPTAAGTTENGPIPGDASPKSKPVVKQLSQIHDKDATADGRPNKPRPVVKQLVHQAREPESSKPRPDLFRDSSCSDYGDMEDKPPEHRIDVPAVRQEAATLTTDPTIRNSTYTVNFSAGIAGPGSQNSNHRHATTSFHDSHNKPSATKAGQPEEPSVNGSGNSSPQTERRSKKFMTRATQDELDKIRSSMRRKNRDAPGVNRPHQDKGQEIKVRNPS